MTGIVWTRCRGYLLAVFEPGDRAALLRRAAQAEAYGDDVVVALEFDDGAGGWTVVTEDDRVWELVQEGDRAWREEMWRDRQERLKSFVPVVQVTVEVLSPEERGEWAELQTFRGGDAVLRAEQLVAKLGLRFDRVRLVKGETKL